jgi:uncharacterized protein YhaN
VHVESVHLHGFGRLTGRTFRFAPGLTVVHGPNEAGKSTLHAAVSASLFGLAGSGRRKREDTARIERFRPWDGGRYAATADVVTDGGRKLRIEWDFDRSRVAIVDAASGADLTREFGGGDPDALVRAVWGVERSVYLRLGHVEQAELVHIDDPSGVRHAIEAVVGQGAADSPAQMAVAALKDRRSRLVGLNSAATKPLARARAEHERLAEAVAEAAAGRAGVDDLAAERDSARAAAEAAERRVRALDDAAAHVRARELRTRIEWAGEAHQAVEAATAILDRDAEHAGFAASTEIGTLRHRLSDLEAERDRRSGERMLDTQRLAEIEREQAALAGRVAVLSPHRGAGARAAEIDELLLAARSGAGRGRILAAAGAAVVVAASATAAAGQLPAAVLIAVAGLVALGLAFRRRPPAAADLDHALPGEGPVETRLTAFREACAGERELDRVERELSRVEVSYAGLRADLAALDQIERERLQVSERIRAELTRSGFADADLDEALRRYEAAAAGHARLLEAAAARREKAAELERLLGDEPLDEARRRLAEAEAGLRGNAALAQGRDLADVEAERGAAEAERARATAAAAGLDAQLAERQRSAPRVAELQEALEAAAEDVERLEHTDAVLRLAQAELQAAADETYRDIAPLLGTALAGPIARLTAGRYSTAFVGDDLGVRLETPERGEVVDLETLSHGTQRQVYLVERIELARLLCPAGATPPVLLDDPFAHVDAERVKRTLAYLAELAGERQLIVFSTDRAAVDLAPSSAAIIELGLERIGAVAAA